MEVRGQGGWGGVGVDVDALEDLERGAERLEVEAERCGVGCGIWGEGIAEQVQDLSVMLL